MQDQSKSVQSRYSSLYNTWCGQDIPKIPFITFTPPLNISNACPANYNDVRVPRQDKQIVLDYKFLGYQSLTHNVAPTATPYFYYQPAYETNKQLQYFTRIRQCDGTFSPQTS